MELVTNFGVVGDELLEVNMPSNRIDITPVTLVAEPTSPFLSSMGDRHAKASGSQPLMPLEASAVPLRSGVLSFGGVLWINTLMLFVQVVPSDMPIIYVLAFDVNDDLSEEMV